MKNKGVFSSILGFSLLSVITAGVGFIILPLSTRLISPDDIGRINMVQTVVALTMPCVCLGLDHGYIRKYKEIERDRSKWLFTSSVIISLVTALLVFVLAFFFWRDISSLMVDYQRVDVLVITLVSVIAYVVERFLLLQHRMENKVSRYAVVSILFMFANKILYVLAAIFVKNFVALLWVMAISELAVVVVTVFIDRKNFSRNMQISKEIPDSLRFGMPLMGAFLISQVTQYLPKFFLRSNGDFSNLGIFSTAVTLSTVVTLLQSGFTLVWTPHVYANHNNPEKAEEINMLQSVLISALTVFVSLIICFQDILVWIVGETYREMTLYLPILLLGPVFVSLGEITGIGINIAKKTKLHLLNNICAVAVTVAVSFILIPKFGSLGASCAATFGSATLFLMRTMESSKLYMPVKNFTGMISSIVLLIALAVSNLLLQNCTIIRYGVFAGIGIVECIFLYHPVKMVYGYMMARRKEP